MKQILPVALLAAFLLPANVIAKQKVQNNDPVVLTINGHDVPRSEFEYLYRKNNLQQETPQPLDRYIDMFVVYKLKVAEAETAGIDTTAAFRDEFNGYCHELFAPFMRDSLVTGRLVNEAYARMHTEREVSHILVPYGKTIAEREANRNKLQEVRERIINGADFATEAKKISVDRSVVANGGNLGFIKANMFPYPFELAAYSTPVGEISEVFEDAPYGYHIIKVHSERPAQGEVSARHILKLTHGLSPEQAEAKKSSIDSIAALLKAGADFNALAKAESEDPGSAQRGGELGYFGQGVMVPEFETVAFALNPGEISAPFPTSYGYHIVQTIDRRTVVPFDQAKGMIENAISRDVRSTMPESEYFSSLRERHNAGIDLKAMDNVRSLIGESSDPAAALESLKVSSATIANFPVGPITVGNVASSMPSTGDDLFTSFSDRLDVMVRDASEKLAQNELAMINPEFRNIINEYRDGILLFEISNRNVWLRASGDRKIQSDYFNANRQRYTWDRPHFKGYVIFATSDSLAREAREFLNTNSVATDTINSAMRHRFGTDVKVEKVLTARGDNAIVDNIAFGGEKAEPVGKWVAWFPYSHTVIDAPEEASDVKALLIADLQQDLESKWIESLRKKYKVKINRKAIDTIVE